MTTPTLDHAQQLLAIAQVHGGVLSAQSIRAAIATGLIHVSPYDPRLVGPCTLDIRMGHNLHLPVGRFRLGSTLERFALPPSIQAQLHGRSSVGRRGIFVHISAGFVDPGFPGELTLECLNVADEPQDLEKGQRVAQLQFTWLDLPTDTPYAGRYRGQTGPTESRFWDGDNGR